MEEIKAKQMVCGAIDHALSGIQDDPRMAQQLLHILHEREARKMNTGIAGRKTSRLIAAALALMLALAGTAFALTRPPVLSWLVGDAPVSPQLESTAQTVIGESTAEGITVRITSLVFDGEKLAFSYEVENQQPTQAVLVSADPAMKIDGKEFRLLFCTADQDAPQMVPSPHLDVLPVKRNPAVGGGEVYVNDIAEGKVTCQLTFRVYRPENRFAVVLSLDSMQANAEAYTGDERAEVEDSLNTLRSFQNAIFAGEKDLTDEHWLSESYTIIDGSGMLYDSPENSHLVEAASISVLFEMDTSTAFACEFASMDDAALHDAMLHVERFRLSALETGIELWLIPQENTEQAAKKLAKKYGEYVLVDEKGQPVQYSDMDHVAETVPDVTQINGQWVCRYLSQMPGLLRFPEAVTFTAGGEDLIRFDLRAEE